MCHWPYTKSYGSNFYAEDFHYYLAVTCMTYNTACNRLVALVTLSSTGGIKEPPLYIILLRFLLTIRFPPTCRSATVSALVVENNPTEPSVTNETSAGGLSALGQQGPERGIAED